MSSRVDSRKKEISARQMTFLSQINIMGHVYEDVNTLSDHPWESTRAREAKMQKIYFNILGIFAPLHVSMCNNGFKSYKNYNKLLIWMLFIILNKFSMIE